MRITKITVENYKSITQPAAIGFFPDLPTILIGKNGSGKTNLLEAFCAVAEENSRFYGRKGTSIRCKIDLCLFKDDISNLFPSRDIRKDELHFTAYTDENGRIDRIESKELVPLLRKEVSGIHMLAKELKEALADYAEQLRNIACSERTALPLRCFEMTNYRDSTTDFYVQNEWAKGVINDANKLVDSILKDFCADDTVLRFSRSGKLFRQPSLPERLSFRLHYVEPDLASFEKPYIRIDKAAIRREVDKINQRTEASCRKITDFLERLSERAARLRDAFDSDEPPFAQKCAFYPFVRQIRECVGAKCLFLQNESRSILFQSEEPYGQLPEITASSMILETYLKKVYDGPDREGLLKQAQSVPLSDDALRRFEDYLNQNIPPFDAGMYRGVSVERGASDRLTILLHENSGKTVSLEQTSAGRRWYFTYYFMKNTLSQGDLFFIDEPAAMLHPIAQKTVLKELSELARSGICVVYSTHSPYLIPDEWNCVHFVSMTDHGTAVVSADTRGAFFDQMKQITHGDIFGLQAIVEKFNSKDASINCYNALEKRFGSFNGIVKAVNKGIIPFSKYTIEAWKKKKVGISFQSFLQIAQIIGLSPEDLLS